MRSSREFRPPEAGITRSHRTRKISAWSLRLAEADSPFSQCCRDSSRMIVVDRYQSIVNTFVQLFISFPSVVIASLGPRFDRENARRTKENEDENTDGVNLPRSIGQHRPQ